MNYFNQMLGAVVILTVTTLLMLLAGCNNNNVPTETMPYNTDSSSTPTSTSLETPSHSPNPTQNGETKTFNHGGLKLEVTNVYEARTESMNDDGGNPREYSVFVCYPGARVTVLTADMSDSHFSADGKPHANWGVLLASGGRKDIVDDMNSFEVTPEILGIYNLESSMYVLKLEMYKNG
ncbi:hypothetical protein BBD42_24695 [Paenibacillus sp. BIHB 4019]|uniref:Uncharacterized protein n=1 Tax=Paenibacillus sp. BIHB 4019 TaxID=1870819 RepID=A0A1B2DNM9_9BACL|nr:hypothetical protein [Paenibacillus sp. BIHB 4019]ANY69325.1 hypothetical protein BBD42_24695 [Paenibacillus sp. BIHB 4019]